jgi:hypothetical protein
MEEISAVRTGRGEKIVLTIVLYVFGHLRGVEGLTSNFLCGGGIHRCFLEIPIEILCNYCSV